MTHEIRNHFIVVLFFFGALLVYFFPAIRAGALSAHNMIYAPPPFELLQREEVGNPLLGDQPWFFEPTHFYAAQSIRGGRLPFWNPYAGLGSPLIANDQSAVFSPLNFFFYLLPFGAATILSALTKLLVAGAGMYFLVYQLFKNQPLALFGAVAFMFSGFNIVWLGHAHTNVSIWLPWLLLLTWLFFTTKRRIYLLPYTLVVALQFFGGHIETSLHILSLTGLLAVGLTFLKKTWRSLVLFLFASVLGFLLAAPQLFPFIEYLINSWVLAYRGGRTPIPYITLPWLIPSILPNFFGNPIWHVYLHQQFPWYKPERFFNYNETVMGFPGTLSFFLAPFVFLNRKWRRWGLGIVLLIAAILLGLLGVPPFFTFLSKVPPFSWTANKRLLLLTSFLVISLAVIGFDRLKDLETSDLQSFWRRGEAWVKEHKRLVLLGVGVFLVLLLGILWLSTVKFQAFSLKVVRKIALNFSYGPKQTLLQFGFVLMAVVTLITLKLKKFITQKIFLLLIAVVALLDGFLYSWNYNPPFGGEFFATVPEIEYLQQHTEFERVLFNGGTLRPLLATTYKINDPRTRDSLVFLPFSRFMELTGADSRVRELVATVENKRFLDFLGVQYLAFTKDDDRGELLGLVRVFEGDSMVIYKNKAALPRAFAVEKVSKAGSEDEALKLLKSESFNLKREVTVEGFDGGDVGELSQGSVSIQVIEPEKASLEVTCPSACFVVMTDTNYPGWKAKVDGKEAKIYKADIAFRGVYIPEGGEHKLEFVYHPASFWNGVVASILALSVLLALVFVQFK